MSAPTKSKSRSRSQKRQEQPPKPVNKSVVYKRPPKQQLTMLNKSNINPGPRAGGGPLDPAFNFENKENHSINYDEFSPSRITDGGGVNEGANRRYLNPQGITTFLDSDSSMSSGH